MNNMRIQLHDPKREYAYLRDVINQAVMRVLESGRWLFGDELEQFEKEYAQYCGVKHALMVANGTDALELALTAVDARGREVITVANAGGYTTSACRIVGAVPVYVDICSDNLLMSLPAAIAAVTPKTAAIVITHIYGRLANTAALRTGLISIGRHDIAIIEDCAQAHGAKADGCCAGSVGDIGTFSFYPTKNLGSMGDGGAVICSDENLAKRIGMLRQYGWSERYQSEIPFGRNSRMDEIQAAVLRIKLGYLDEWNEKRRKIVSRYHEAAPSLIWFDRSAAFVGHLAIARHPERDRVRALLNDVGIMTAIHYPTMDFDQPGQRGLSCVVHDLSVTRQTVMEIFTLPCFSEMTDEEIAFVCETLRRIV